MGRLDYVFSNLFQWKHIWQHEKQTTEALLGICWEGFWEGAQNAKSGPGGARTRNERLYKEKYKKTIGFWGGAQNEESGPGGARARNERLYKEEY